MASPPLARTKPPFRADQVGSLKKPQALIDAYKARDKKEIPEENSTRSSVPRCAKW
jgi:methionine synthase II (cobalamin-independent)